MSSILPNLILCYKVKDTFYIFTPMKVKILISDDVHPQLIKNLEGLGFEIDFFPNITLEEVGKIIKSYNGLIINSKIIVSESLLSSTQNLEFVARLGSGMEIIDFEATKKRNIKVFNSPKGNCDAVAEHAIGLLLALANKLVIANNEVKQFSWNREKNRGFEIGGKTIGIIGLGHTGSSFARKLSGFETKIVAYDKYLVSKQDGLDHVEMVGLEELKQKTDILSFHLPLNLETKFFGNNDFFQSFKKNIVVINTSRGSIIKTEDLIKNIENKKIIGAGLDVFENENPNSYTFEEREMYKRLFNNENVIVSPHIAGWSIESKFKLSNILFEQIKQLYFDEKCK
ncbi:MAG: hypothetical protein IPL95_18365 [Saprospiraceae bacterium]|nr:hypothetical protein [Saprospiraceae bacterium]